MAPEAGGPVVRADRERAQQTRYWPAPQRMTLADVWPLCRQWDDQANAGAAPMRETT